MDVALKLLEIIEDMEVGYQVMGAYGHSRFAKSPVGGVTRSLLLKSQVPLILSHRGYRRGN